MTLSTDIYIKNKIDRGEVWQFVNQSLGIPPTVKHNVTESGIDNLPAQGFMAWVMVHAPASGEPERPTAATCDEYCETPCDQQHDPPHWVRVNLDSTYGCNKKTGLSCTDIHKLVMRALRPWLHAKGNSFIWRNEFEGTLHADTDETALEAFR